MSRRSPSQERALRIELLRARAALERQSLALGVQHLGRSLTPRGLLASFLPGDTSRKSPADYLLQALRLTRRYPLVLSLGSSLLSGVARRKSRWWKLAAAAVVAWQVSRAVKK
ncbi:hypothetical protein VRY85_12615 [Achromobacter sp. F4_2707]|uniref:hypothetical protein n=1 Tax=Achromobacter sp. F4_2707 TaxID=3114286 RepID=UPI0039C5E622